MGHLVIDMGHMVITGFIDTHNFPAYGNRDAGVPESTNKNVGLFAADQCKWQASERWNQATLKKGNT